MKSEKSVLKRQDLFFCFAPKMEKNDQFFEQCKPIFSITKTSKLLRDISPPGNRHSWRKSTMNQTPRICGTLQITF